MADSLPYDAEVEYLRSTGTQYINTGIVQTTRNYEVTLVMQWTGSTASLFESFFAYMPAVGAFTPRCGFHKYDSHWMFGTNATQVTSNALDNNKHTIYITGNASVGIESLYIDNTFITHTNTSNHGIQGNTITYFLGCRNRNGSTDNPAWAKFYSLNYKKFTDANHSVVTDEWDFIPVRLGTIGYMYDRISGNLLGNSGSGSFVLGNDI